MKYKMSKNITIMLMIILILPYIFSISSYAATNYTFFQGFKIVKRYMPEEVYWIIGISTSQTTEIKVPAVANDNKEITAIYDNTKTTGVFQGNPWLEKVDLSESKIQTIGTYCFYNCNSLTTYINSPYLKTILSHGFQNANLNSITLNDGLETIGNSAFEDAFSNNKTIYIIDIPDTVTTIGENAFKVTNKNYRVILVGKKGSVAEEYCKTDLKCTFVERGEDIPTEEELIQQEIEKEKKQLFINSEFTYKNFNNTNTANSTMIFGLPASTLEANNWEYFSDIITVDDGYIVVGRSYLDRYNYDLSNYYKEMIESQIKGNDDAIIVKYNQNFNMEWVKSFGGSLGEGFSKIYKTSDGGFLIQGITNSIDKDLLGINNDSNKNYNMFVKYDGNFNVKEVKLQDELGEYENEIIKREKWEVSDGNIYLGSISDGTDDLTSGIDGYETNATIKKYDKNNYLQWSKVYDRNSSHTDDSLNSVVETDEAYIFVGSSAQQKINSHNQPIYVQDAIIVKYNKPYDKIMINSTLSYEMNVGEQRKVDLFYVPWEDVTIGEMQWTSQNEQIASVDYKGNITAKAEGTTEIDLNIRGKTEKIIVSVKDPTIKHIENIKLDKNQIELKKGEYCIISATITPEDTVDSKEIGWTSSNQEVATVDENGKVTAIAEGTATITAETINGKIDTCIVAVKNIQGDINGDGRVNIKDWNILYGYINETSELDENQLECADTNEDGKVNIKDWNRLYNHITEVEPLI